MIFQNNCFQQNSWFYYLCIFYLSSKLELHFCRKSIVYFFGTKVYVNILIFCWYFEVNKTEYFQSDYYTCSSDKQLFDFGFFINWFINKYEKGIDQVKKQLHTNIYQKKNYKQPSITKTHTLHMWLSYLKKKAVVKEIDIFIYSFIPYQF